MSLIIEWENARLAEAERASTMVGTLSAQIAQLDRARWPRVEVLFVYERDAIDPSVIEQVLASRWMPQPHASTRLVACDHGGYYELKNAGARLASGDLLLFLDSDVIPENGWLEALLKASAQPGVDVVGGTTYIAPVGLLGKAFALFWFFPLRDTKGGLRKSDFFFANNVAFARSTFSAHPFPSREKFRGQCEDLVDVLRRAGVPVYLEGRARVSHPAPNGAWHFLCRALAAGHDEVVNAQAQGQRRTLKHSCWSLSRHLRRSLSRIEQHRTEVDLARSQKPAAAALAATYYLTMFLGEVMARISPALVARRFRI